MHQQPLASASKDMTDVAVLPLLNTIYMYMHTDGSQNDVFQ